MISTFPFERVSIPEKLIGERVVLRPWQMADAPVLFEMIDQSRERLRRWMFWIEHSLDLADTEEFLSNSVANWKSRRELGMAIIERETGRILGSTGFHNINWSVPLLEIGYWLGNGNEGNGYVSEAVRLQMALAFDDLQVQRLAITCDPENTRSRAVAERLGFTPEGAIRNHVRTPEGRLRDTLVFSMTPEQYGNLFPGSYEDRLEVEH